MMLPFQLFRGLQSTRLSGKNTHSVAYAVDGMDPHVQSLVPDNSGRQDH